MRESHLFGEGVELLGGGGVEGRVVDLDGCGGDHCNNKIKTIIVIIIPWQDFSSM